MTRQKPVFSKSRKQNDLIQAAIRRAISGGARPSDLTDLVSLAMGDDAPSRAIIGRMVTTIDSEVHRPRQKSFGELPPLVPDQPEDDGVACLDPDNLPSGVSLAKDLAAKYGITPGAIRNWIRFGRIKEVGRVKGKAGGHGGFIAVREADVIYCQQNPRPGGRPRKP